MRKIQIVGIVFAAVLAFSMVSVGGASALSLWDQCTKTASALEFTENNCVTKGSSPTWGWEEITSLLTAQSSRASLRLNSGPITLGCEGRGTISIGPGNEGEVIRLLTTAGAEITEAKPVECKIEAGGSVCTSPATVSPDNLPWLTLLQATGGDLLEGSGAGNPGWLVLCANSLENLCTKAETLLELENLESELEVDLTFNPAEEVECTNALAKKGKVEGTVSISAVGGPIASLPTALKLTSGPITLRCEGIADGSNGPGNEDEITKLLTVGETEITEAKPVECKIEAGGAICTSPATVSPDNLPWRVVLETTTALLKGSGAGNPGWLVLCANSLENLCTKAETLLELENLESELEVDLTFKPAEEVECTNALAKKGKVEGTVSISTVGEPIASLPAALKLTSGPITLQCEGIADGSNGPSNENEITKLLTVGGSEITEAKPVECKIEAGGSLCTSPATVSPDSLPWRVVLETTTALLKGSGAGNPGWLVLCANGLENLCSKAETLLKLENLESESEVDLTFNPAEEVECTNTLAKKGKVEGTVSILQELLEGGNALHGTIRAM
jgi:hypothetical protein